MSQRPLDLWQEVAEYLSQSQWDEAAFVLREIVTGPYPKEDREYAETLLASTIGLSPEGVSIVRASLENILDSPDHSARGLAGLLLSVQCASYDSVDAEIEALRKTARSCPDSHYSLIALSRVRHLLRTAEQMDALVGATRDLESAIDHYKRLGDSERITALTFEADLAEEQGDHSRALDLLLEVSATHPSMFEGEHRGAAALRLQLNRLRRALSKQP